MRVHVARAARWLLAAACVILPVADAAPAADDLPVAPGRPDAVEAPMPAVEAVEMVQAVQLVAPAGPAPVIHPQVNMAGFSREYHPVPMDAAAADAAVRAALDRRIEGAWEFQEASLRDVVNSLQEFLRVTVVLDERKLEESGIDPDGQTVTARLSGMTARAALRVLLAPLGLASLAADEVLTITTPEETWERLTQVAYPLPRWAGVNGDPGAEKVVDLIQNTVAMATWDTVGGPGSIRVVEASGEPLLVISQTGDVHDAVERLLRALHGRALAEFDGGAVVLKIHPVADDRARTDLATRLKNLCNTTLGDDADPDAEVESVAATLAVQSRSPLFHALAAQVIAAVTGRPPPPQPMGGMGGGGAGP